MVSRKVWIYLGLIFMDPYLVSGQDVGMGVRKSDSERLEAAYRLDIQTDHVPWAKPLRDGPIRMLAVPSVQEGRTLIELAQRIELELSTVTIDPAWDNNKWTMCFGEDYGARAEQGDLGLIYGYLEQEMTSSKQFDVILLPLHHGWEALTPATRQALVDRVRRGCGLVLIRPFDRELSPLIPGAGEEVAFNSYRNVEPESETGVWQRSSEHYIVRGIPVEEFPFEYLENYRYELAPGAEVLISTTSGTPVAATREFGQGRVVAFGYRNIGISWRMGEEASLQDVDLQWEYFYSLLVRSILYAAGREVGKEPDFDSPETRWVLKSEAGEVLKTGNGQTPEMTELKPGRYFIERFLDNDWRISPLIIEQADSIGDIRMGRDVLSEGIPVTVGFQSSGPARISLKDGFGRLLALGTSETGGRNEILLKPERPLTHGGFLEVEVGTARKRMAVRFAATTRDWSDYEVIMPWFGPNSYQPWTPVLDEQFRRIGITTLADPRRNFKIIASVHEPVFGIYWYRRAEYEKRKKEFLKTNDKSLITRNISLHSPDLLNEMRERFGRRVGSLLALKPFAYYLADESSLTCYADAFDVDFSPADLAAFRLWLREEYDSLEELNQTWGTNFSDWGQVIPMTAMEAQEHGNFTSWSDHRVFMEESFIRIIAEAGKMAKEFDPGARASFSGTQIPAPHNGANWYEIDQVVDYLQPYSGGNQDPMHYLFNPALRLTGFTGYGLVGEDIQSQVWRRLFYGHSGASIFWHYTLLNPDLSFSLQGSALAKVFGRIQSGIGRIFMNSDVIEDGVAVHFSMASIRGSWITDGKIVDRVVSAQRTSEAFAELMRRRDEWVDQLEGRGIQFRFLATPQIESGELANCRVLILPYSIALSGREVEEIEKFAARGGLVYLDEHTGRMDEKLRWRKERLWGGGEKNFLRSGPDSLELTRAIDIEGDFLTTIRRFGKGRLCGLLPETEKTVQLPGSTSVRYDLLRGGLAESVLRVSPEEPLLILERERPIESIRIDDGFVVYLKDDRGQPVDRSVVSMKVYDPEGNHLHYYSRDIDIQEGRGTFEIPFALNDPLGTWKVYARDVISGLEAELILIRD